MPTRNSGRAAWHRPANSIVLGYLAASIAVAVFEAARDRSWPPPWLATHVFLLGAVTNAIVIWTAHFATTLLAGPTRTRPTSDRQLTVVLGVLNIGVVVVLIAVPHDAAPAVVVGAALIFSAIVVRASAMAAMLCRASRARFVPVVRFYVAAAVALMMGIAAGTALEVGLPADWYARVYATHVELNLFGWIAFTVIGTQVALWPMVLRTRIVSGAEIAATHGLPVCAAGLLITVGALLSNSRAVAGAGICLYILGAIRALEPFARTALQRTPRSPSALMLVAAMGWFLGGLAADLGKLLAAPNLSAFAGAVDDFVPWLLIGYVVQVLMGALTYLLPVVLGGGPSGGRRLSTVLDRYGVTRLGVFNLGAMLIAATRGGVPGAVGWSLVGASVGAFCLLAAAAVAISRR